MIGQNDTLYLHLGDDKDAAGLCEALKSLPEVIQASSSDNQVVLIVPEASALAQ